MKAADGVIQDKKRFTPESRRLRAVVSTGGICRMDFVGQKHYEYTATILYLIEGFVCFVIGFALKDFEMMIKIFFAVGSVTGLLLLPDSKYWPISWAFSRNPLKWLPPLEPEDAPPPPPTITQKLLKLVGLSGGESQPSTEQPKKKKSAGRKER